MVGGGHQSFLGVGTKDIHKSGIHKSLQTTRGGGQKMGGKVGEILQYTFKKKKKNDRRGGKKLPFNFIGVALVLVNLACIFFSFL